MDHLVVFESERAPSQLPKRISTTPKNDGSVGGFAVLLELLDQYMMGGMQPTRDDLNHVFLRFGKRR